MRIARDLVYLIIEIVVKPDGEVMLAQQLWAACASGALAYLRHGEWPALALSLRCSCSFCHARVQPFVSSNEFPHA